MKDMKNQRKSITISPAVAEAINNMLFSSDGVDMTPVIDALAADKSRDRASVAITTALLLKKIPVEPSKEVRYEVVEPGDVSGWAKFYVREYTYKSYAPYDNKVYFKSQVIYSQPRDGEDQKDLCRCHQVGYVYENDMSEEAWEFLSEFDELPKELQDVINGEKAFSDMCKIVDPE